MKRIALSAIALSLATPVLADQPKTALDVRRHFAASESGNEARVYVSDYKLTRKAAQLHVDIAQNADMNGVDLTIEQLLDAEGGIVNERAARIFMQLDSEDNG